MQIEAVEIRNFRALRDVKLEDLPSLVTLIGPNGTGKSTVFDVFSFLKDSLTGTVGKAVLKRGGYKELVSRGSEGPIEIVLKFRETGGRLATYELSVGQDAGQAIVEKEILKFRRGQAGRPWHFVEFSRGKGRAIVNESLTEKYEEAQRDEFLLDAPDILAIKGLGQFKVFRIVSEFRTLIENWHISDFHIADARPSAEEGYSEHLSTRGDNVAQVAQYLYTYHPERFQKILEAMESRVPGVTKVDAKSTEDGRLVLRFQDGAFQDPFIARFVSDGTIKMFTYLVLLNDPKPFPLLAIEEPENQLFPDLLLPLAEEFREYASRGGQVFISTHSPYLLDALKLKEIYWLTKKIGFTTIEKAENSAQLKSLIDEGDLPGQLWKQGLFEEIGR